MDWILYLKAVILGIVEGLTGVLPVFFYRPFNCFRKLVGLHGSRSRHVFTSQFRLVRIVAVCWYYRERIVRIMQRTLLLNRLSRNLLGIRLLPFFRLQLLA